MKTIKTIIMICIVSVMLNCNKDTNDIAFTTNSEKESYSLTIKGDHPTLKTIDTKIEVKERTDIHEDKITLKADPGSHYFSIVIHLPAKETPSHKSESIGFVIYDKDKTDIWKENGLYRFTSSPYVPKRASIDYILDNDAKDFYNGVDELYNYNIAIKNENGRLIGTFDRIPLKYHNTRNAVRISGSFNASLASLK